MNAESNQTVGFPCAPVRKSSRRSRALITAIVVAGLAVGGLWSLKESSHGTDSATVADTTGREVREALSGFLAAATAEERVAFITGEASALPILQSYYAVRETEKFTAAAFRSVEWSFNPTGEKLAALTLGRDRGMSSVVACFRREKDGKWRMDWDVWQQTVSGEFRDFMAHPQEGEYTLRVRLANMGEKEGAISLEVSDPFDPQPSLQFSITREDLRAILLRDLPQGHTRTATVQLVWLNEGSTGTLQSHFRRHICWGYAGLDGKPAAELPHPRAGHYRKLPARPAEEPLAAKTWVDDSIKAALSATAHSSLVGDVQNPPVAEGVASKN